MVNQAYDAQLDRIVDILFQQDGLVDEEDEDVPMMSWAPNHHSTQSHRIPFQKPPIPFPYPLNSYNSLITCPKRAILEQIPLPTFPEIQPNSTTYLYLTPDSWAPIPLNLLRKFILFPELLSGPFSNMMMVTLSAQNKQPFHLPDLSDVETLFPVIVTFTRWSLQHRRFSEFPLLPWELEFLLNPTPVFPQLRNTFRLTPLPLELEIASHSNALFIAQTQRPYIHIQLDIAWKTNLTTPGRTLFARVHPSEKSLISSSTNSKQESPGKQASKGKEPLISPYEIYDPMTMLFWNARGISRPSFQRNIQHLAQCHYLP